MKKLICAGLSLLIIALTSCLFHTNDTPEVEKRIADYVLAQSKKIQLPACDSITIGTQTWATKNLNVITFCNGDTIPEAKSDKDWTTAGDSGRPAWCYYNMNPAYGIKFGRLYNWFAVNDDRGLAPLGWHIPTDSEWTILTTYLGGFKTAGIKMKSTLGWLINGNGNNSSGFFGLPAGMRDGWAGEYGYIGESAFFWTNTRVKGGDDKIAWFYALDDDSIHVRRDNFGMSVGFSVRCVKD